MFRIFGYTVVFRRSHNHKKPEKQTIKPVNRREKRYTKEELLIVKSNLPPRVVARRLGRTKQAIYNLRYKLNQEKKETRRENDNNEANRTQQVCVQL